MTRNNERMLRFVALHWSYLLEDEAEWFLC